MASPSLGRETLNLLTGRAANLVLSLTSLALYPVLLGPKAHGELQYYFGLFLLLLGYLNGCAAPMMAHFIAIYRVTEPGRQPVFIAQVLRWFFVLLISLWAIYPFLADRTGFGWIFVGVAFSGLAQVLSSAHYGVGRIGPSTWFPVLILACRLLLICGGAWWVRSQSGEGALMDWTRGTVPLLLVLASTPALLWMFMSFWAHRSDWYSRERTSGGTLFPWTEIRRLGIAAMVGQLIYQLFTRSLVPLAKQWGYPEEQVGYLGLAMQGYGLVVFLAGIFSVSAYPWMVSAWEAGERDRFSRIQSEAWRMSALLGGWIAACMIALGRPLVWVVLGEAYRGDIDILVRLIQIGAVAGVFMLAAEFHLRMLLSITDMRQYLWALVFGFAPSVPFLAWVHWTGQPIEPFAWTLAVGVGGLMAWTLWYSPPTLGFLRVTSLAAAGAVLGGVVSLPLQGETLVRLTAQGVVLTLLYAGWAWLAGLANASDFARVLASSKPRVDEAAP